MIKASPALQTAKTTELQKPLSPRRLALTVAANAPTTTGHRARGPSAISNPAETPAAGQNTATPSGFVSRARASRAARKYAIATATVSSSQAAVMRVPLTKLGNGRRTIVGNPAKLNPRSGRKCRMLRKKMRVAGDVGSILQGHEAKGGEAAIHRAPAHFGGSDKRAPQAVNARV